jgi:hypothetical protein
MATQVEVEDEDLFAATLRRSLDAAGGAEWADALISMMQAEVAQAITRPPERQGHAMELIVLAPAVDVAASINIGNLLRNAVDPRSMYRAVAALGGAQGLASAGVAPWLAFMLGMTSLAARPVAHAAACVLHKAWRITPRAAPVTVAALAAVAHEITDEYGVVKVTPSDLQTYLDDLERAGAVRSSSQGYFLRERVLLADIG